MSLLRLLLPLVLATTTAVDLRPADAAGLTRILSRERSALAELEGVNLQVIREQESLDDLRYQRQQNDYRLSEAGRRIEALSRRTEQRRAHLRSRLRVLYKLSRGSLVRLLLGSDDHDEQQRTATALTRLVERDVAELRLYRQEVAQLVSGQRALVAQQRAQRELLAKLQRKQRDLDRARAEQRKLLHRLRADRRLRVALEGELSARQQRLLRQISNLDYRIRHDSGHFAGARGRLPRPASGPVVARFGEGRDPRTGLGLSRSGITIRARRGAAVRAVAPGTVRLARQLEGYGQVVLVDHNDGYYTLTGFLDQLELRAGQRVKVGAVIGRAGRDPLSGHPAVYFEIRRGQRALDPDQWLGR